MRQKFVAATCKCHLSLKVSEACKRVFAEIAQAEGLSAAALFEDMVVERQEKLAKAGVLEG